LNQDLGGGSGIAADRFSGALTDHSDADCGSGGGGGDVNVAGHFCDHHSDVYLSSVVADRPGSLATV
jgi:hypothetical protein